jgi:hypothetical protein
MLPIEARLDTIAGAISAFADKIDSLEKSVWMEGAPGPKL